VRRALAAVLLGLAACAGPRRPADPSAVDRALQALSAADLAGADAALPGSADPPARHLLGRIRLLQNRNREAAALLAPLVSARVEDLHDLEQRQRASQDLLSAQLRLDDHAGAARTARFAGDAALARRFDALARGAAYAAAGTGDPTSVPFVATHPAPLVPAAVNGRPGSFLIDTRRDDLVLDADFARRAGAAEGSASVDLGRWTISRVPFTVERLPAIGAHEVSGAIGLSLLMHYDFTIDFRRSRLTLQAPGTPPPGGVAVLRAGERHLLIEARANGRLPVYVGLDTALRGVTLAGSEFFLQQLGGRLVELTAGSLRLSLPAVDPNAFPSGLDDSFGVPAAFVLGNEGLRGRSVRVDPRAMRAWID
jgi:hypothetical protein